MKAFIYTLLLAGSIAAQAAPGDKIRILNEDGQPIAGANILIGSQKGNPWENNEVLTDLNGEITVPLQWTAALPITITAADYLSASFLAVDPTAATYQLHRGDARNPIQVKGDSVSFPNIKKDGKVDFALVFPAFRRRQLVQFDVNSMISPEFDEIEVISQKVAIPSNLTLPQQQESYILPVTFNKPTYRVFVNQPGNYRITATHGQFPLKQVVNDIQNGKSFFDVINYFRFIGGGQRDVTVNSPVSDQNIPVNQISYSQSLTVQAPTIPQNLVMVSFSLISQGGLMFPADIKKVESNSTQTLLVPTQADKHYIVSVLTHKQEGKPKTDPGNEDGNDGDIEASWAKLNKALAVLMQSFQLEENDPIADRPEEKISGAISLALQESTETTPQFLNLIDAPKMISNTHLSMTAPAPVTGVTPVATYVTLSEIDHVKMGDKEIERRFRIWEGFQTTWANEFIAPASAIDIRPGKKYRWEVLYLGKNENHSRTDSNYFLDTVTHVTRNSLDF